MANPRWLTAWGILLAVVVLSPGQVAASDHQGPYVTLYGGVTYPQAFGDAQTVSNPAATFADFDLERSTIYGGKVGAFLEDPTSWLGIEAEFFYTNPHIRQQDVEVFVNGVSAGPANFAGAHVRVATGAVNWIARYPGQRLQPYIGAGPGIFWGRMSGEELGTGSDTSLGLNAQAGIRIFLTEHLALFGEYKYNRVTFDFGGTADLHVLYQVHHVVGGVSLHF